MKRDLKFIFFSPYKIETELARGLIQKLDLLIIIGGYLGQHGLQWYVVEYDGWTCLAGVRPEGIGRYYMIGHY